MITASLELAASSLLGTRDNPYTTRSMDDMLIVDSILRGSVALKKKNKCNSKNLKFYHKRHENENC